MICDPEFRALLIEFGVESAESEPGSVFGCWADSRLAYFNPGWFAFAHSNGGLPTIPEEWNLGRRMLDAVADPLRLFFEDNIHRCLRERRPWEHLYECSSAESHRKFHMTTFPLGGGAGFLVVNSLYQQVPQLQIPSTPVEQLYRNSAGIVTQCCHCRRTRRVGSEHDWDWVAEWVKNQPRQTSHGICAGRFSN